MKLNNIVIPTTSVVCCIVITARTRYLRLRPSRDPLLAGRGGFSPTGTQKSIRCVQCLNPDSALLSLQPLCISHIIAFFPLLQLMSSFCAVFACYTCYEPCNVAWLAVPGGLHSLPGSRNKTCLPRKSLTSWCSPMPELTTERKKTIMPS